MKLGLHISNFTWDGGPVALRQQVGDVAVRAERAGYDRVSVMDHLWQIGHVGPPEHEMLEAYTTLGFLAAKTEHALAGVSTPGTLEMGERASALPPTMITFRLDSPSDPDRHFCGDGRLRRSVPG